jgi:hypothetical protein
VSAGCEIGAAFASGDGDEGAQGWYYPDVTRIHVELHASDSESENDRSNPVTMETNVDVQVRVLPAFTVQSQIHLAPSRRDGGDGEENDDRPAPASVVPTTTSSISSGLSQIRVP